MSLTAYRTLITTDPFRGSRQQAGWNERTRWPASWIRCVEASSPPSVAAYRLRFSLETQTGLRVHVSADERYMLYLDSALIGRGSERGGPTRWFYESMDLHLSAGTHTLVALVWALGEHAPIAQISAGAGFLLAAEGEHAALFNTGTADWQAKLVEGYTFFPLHLNWTGSSAVVDARWYPWGVERGEGDDWSRVERIEPAYSSNTNYDFPRHRLQSAMLPPMVYRPITTGRVRAVAPLAILETENEPVHETQAVDWTWRNLQIAPHTHRRYIIDLDNYYCAFTYVHLSGGAGSSVRVRWAESLYEGAPDSRQKGNRDVIEGKYFTGIGETFLPDGGADRQFDTLWWRSGRYVEIVIETWNEPLIVHAVTLYETRYPLEMESTFEADDTRLNRLAPILLRGLQMCAHETYVDCPYYEQLMYVGDSRLETLVTYAITHDDSLPRKAITLFNESRLSTGLTQSRYPCRSPQVIPPFALWWVGMLYDYALWRDDPAFVRSFLPGLRATLEEYERNLDSDGFLPLLDGWNFMDWVVDWPAGIPPGALDGISPFMNWQFVLILTNAAKLETAFGRDSQAQHNRALALALTTRLISTFWDEQRGLFAEDRAHQHFLEHTQCMAVLSGILPTSHSQRIAQALAQDTNLTQTTIYFSHYLLETYHLLGLHERLLDRLGLWFGLVDLGLKTTVEQPEPTRSDCHGWGTHPLYHFFTSILGIRPAEFGFRTVEIRPGLGHLQRAQGTMVHPQGMIAVELRHEEPHQLYASIMLPEGVTGMLYFENQTVALKSGSQQFSIASEQ